MFRPVPVADPAQQCGGAEEDHGLGQRFVDGECPDHEVAAQLGAKLRNTDAGQEQQAWQIQMVIRRSIAMRDG